ncbi:MAG: Maf family nucleotide pyrophosphatase [Sphaerochaeta sp.]|jgi:septum formation protein|nr:Maf family nucleotide pyrophosphatase [Sphaerochaeta sp.]MCH3920878.1 Maf family nucleotide pyrophosphatase [Sphaerochaeta sp.]MCI2045226.1 Maf family nucleotide pyrophosphatase [Sphaerochaeta sp.]MCI2076674.1 Maf family nucleotide pyrophosphatase [Sphaerochaeta sp.]MCI2096707.1 Maf family nucleotide pyrophosphatase [Sphaerochaeta sp.]
MKTLATRFPRLILASQSPARREILCKEGIDVTVMPTGADESTTITEPKERVRLLALKKLSTFLSVHPNPPLPVLACDTLVSLDGAFIGKAKDRDEAYQQLFRFSAKRQMVESGWALYEDGHTFSGADAAFVTFRTLDKETIEGYLDTGEWRGAAGSYRIQGKGDALIASVEGDVNTVVGLPLLALRAAFL